MLLAHVGHSKERFNFPPVSATIILSKNFEKITIFSTSQLLLKITTI